VLFFVHEHTLVFDPKVQTVAYNENARILEISFKNGQTWQLRSVAPDTCDDPGSEHQFISQVHRAPVPSQPRAASQDREYPSDGVLPGLQTADKPPPPNQ